MELGVVMARLVLRRLTGRSVVGGERLDVFPELFLAPRTSRVVVSGSSMQVRQATISLQLCGCYPISDFTSNLINPYLRC